MSPAGASAEGIAGAFRKLRFYGQEELRRMDFGRFACSFIPPTVVADDSICFGDEDGLINTPESTVSWQGQTFEYDLVNVDRICIYGDEAPSYAATVWGIVFGPRSPVSGVGCVAAVGVAVFGGELPSRCGARERGPGGSTNFLMLM